MTASQSVYRIRRGARAHDPHTQPWKSDAWGVADTAYLTQFRPEGTGHRPETKVRLLYDSSRVYGIFVVHDRFVRSVRTRFGDMVYEV
jgi:hypothetical protein